MTSKYVSRFGVWTFQNYPRFGRRSGPLPEIRATLLATKNGIRGQQDHHLALCFIICDELLTIFRPYSAGLSGAHVTYHLNIS